MDLGGDMVGYDTIVVGAGSAGCVLANRLSADPRHSVLLLEAGPAYAPDGFPDALTDADRLGGGTAHDWGYMSEPGRLGYSIAAQSGRVLGGGSTINAGVAKRARADDFARWRRHGVEGWSFEDALAAYKALENTPDGDDRWHGRSGPFPIRQLTPEKATPALRAFVDAAAGLGFDRIGDFNGPDQNGVGYDPFNVVDGRRMNTGIAYLARDVRSRPNLTIRSGVHVDCVLFDGRRAAGLRLAGGEPLEAGRIILCAGVYGTPAILMRSGIGPAGPLRQLSIEVVADLPVGRTLRDHPFYYNVHALKPEAGDMSPARGTTLWTGSQEAIGETLDLQVTAANLRDDDGTRRLVLAAAVTVPDSTGSVCLRSRDPHAPPWIDYNLLAAPRDRRRLLEAVRLARRIARTPPLRDLVDREISPDPSIVDDTALQSAIEADLDTYHHGTSTVPMGGENDQDSVVDQAGRVRGIQGLRVVDASIFPEIPSTPINLTVIMLAERLAAIAAD